MVQVPTVLSIKHLKSYKNISVAIVRLNTVELWYPDTSGLHG